MSDLLTRELLESKARIVPAPIMEAVAAPHFVDRSFELPKALYGATVALYLGFIGVMAVGFPSPGLAIPMAIFALFIVAGFAVPALWTRLAPDEGRVAPLDLARFRNRGIATLTGRLSARDAMAQVLILPVLIFAWGVTVVMIAALV